MNKNRYALIVMMVLLLGGQHGISAAEVNDTAPAFELPGLDDNKIITLKDYAGKIVYLDFWASWCPPCLVSMPIMNDLRNKLQQQGINVEVLAVNVDSDAADGADFLLDTPVDFVVLSDPEGKTPALYGVRGMPTSYLIDKQGKIVMRHEGFKRSDANIIEDRILELARQGN